VQEVLTDREGTPKYDKEGEQIIVTKQIVNATPTITGFAVRLGIHRDRIYEWMKDYPDFRDVMKANKMQTEDRLLQNGLRGRTVPAVSIFALQNIAGWKDKSYAEERLDELTVPLSTVSANNSPRIEQNANHHNLLM